MQNNMRRIKTKSAFTIVEMLIAISVFSIVVVTTSMIFVDSLRLDRKTSLQQQIFIDARFTLDQIASAISQNAIDYNEYYNQIVKAAESGRAEFTNPYGANHGAYTAQFYNPGQGDDLGSFCNDFARTRHLPGGSCTLLTRTIDKDTGQNPYARSDALPVAEPRRSNAVCLGVKADGTSQSVGRCRADIDIPDAGENVFPELFLISPDGMTKTIYVREAIAEDPIAYSLSHIRMQGRDINGDSIPDLFSCDDTFGFSCRGDNASACGAAGITCPLQSDKGASDFDLGDDETNFFDKDFVPISPNRITIKELSFTVSPLEDPHYAYAESDLETQKLPHVTITMTVEPNLEIVGATSGEFRSLTLQETVTTTALTRVSTPILGQF